MSKEEYEKIQITKEMLKDNVSIEKIEKFTNLKREKIEKIMKENNIN